MSNTVNIGSKIKVQINGQIQQLQIVGSADINVNLGKISYLSPIGEASLGKAEGESFEVILPNGKKLIGKVIKVD